MLFASVILTNCGGGSKNESEKKEETHVVEKEVVEKTVTKEEEVEKTVTKEEEVEKTVVEEKVVKSPVNEKCGSFELSIYNSAKSKIIKGQDYTYYFNKARQYVNNSSEKSYEAVVNFEQAIKLFPKNGGVYSDIGNCYRGGFKCYEKAKYYYSKAIENGFSQGFVYYNRATCNYELDKLDEMKSDFEMSRELGWSNDYYKLSEK